MKKYINNIDDCTVFLYAKAMQGDLSYLYSDENKRGTGEENIKLQSAFLQINEELQGDEINPFIFNVVVLEALKLRILQLEWAKKLLAISVIQKNRDKLKNVFQKVQIPLDLKAIKRELSQLQNKYNMKIQELKEENEQENQKERINILQNVADLNVILESNFIDAKKTSIRDFVNYSKIASKKIEQMNKKK